METKKTRAERAYNRKLLWRFLRGSKLNFLISMLAAAAAAICDMVTPQVVRVAVDNALGGKEAHLPAFAMRLAERAGGFRYLGVQEQELLGTEYKSLKEVVQRMIEKLLKE